MGREHVNIRVNVNILISSSVPCLIGANVDKSKLLYLPAQIRFPIAGERVTCRRSKLINSLGRAKLTNWLWKRNNNMNFRLARDQVMLLETEGNL